MTKATTPANGYPPNWKEISLAIRARSGGQCECTGQCGLHRGRRCEERHKEPARWARGQVILTVAHWPDHTPSNIDPSNLTAACQRCHLRMDRDLHAQHAAQTRQRRRREAFDQAEEAGQGRLPFSR